MTPVFPYSCAWATLGAFARKPAFSAARAGLLGRHRRQAISTLLLFPERTQKKKFKRKYQYLKNKAFFKGMTSLISNRPKCHKESGMLKGVETKRFMSYIFVVSMVIGFTDWRTVK